MALEIESTCWRGAQINAPQRYRLILDDGNADIQQIHREKKAPSNILGRFNLDRVSCVLNVNPEPTASRSAVQTLRMVESAQGSSKTPILTKYFADDPLLHCCICF